jgi:hypothetical protein
MTCIKYEGRNFIRNEKNNNKRNKEKKKKKDNQGVDYSRRKTRWLANGLMMIDDDDEDGLIVLRTSRSAMK